VFIATKESNIRSIKDFKGKRIMTAPEADISVALYAMMNRQGMHTSDLIYLKDPFDVNDLINKKTDLMSAYETNELYVLKEKGVDVTIFDPKKYGFDFYNDILFTSYDEAQYHTTRTTEFTNASLRGWEYAFDHIDETVDLIIRKYNTQHKSREALLFEAKALKAIAYSGNNKNLGEIDWGKIQRIYDLYNVSGLLKKQYDVKSMQFADYRTLKNYAKPIDSTPVWIMVGLFLFIIVIIILRQRRLQASNISLEADAVNKSQQLEESQNLLEKIFYSTRESMGIVDKDTRFVFANRAYLDMIGYDKIELYQKKCLELTLEEDIAITMEALKTVAETGYVDGVEKRCRKSDGTIIEARLSIDKIDDTDHYLIIAEDITQENIHKYERKQQEIQMLYQSRLAQMGEMISMIAHQWRQPLGAIAATSINIKFKVELEAFDLDNQEGRTQLSHFLLEKLTNIENYVENLTTTIDDFRNFYKPDKKSVLISLKEVAHKALRIIRNSIEMDNISIIEEYGDDMQLEMYDNEVMQVILNILKNAHDNFKEKNIINPQIKITVTPGVLYICDNGGGIPDEILDKIFDPYFSTKDEKNGTGLGLYMSKIIIEEHHNGKLRAKNQDGGTSFQINFKK
jgi:PAS domain S-box-containing protein